MLTKKKFDFKYFVNYFLRIGFIEVKSMHKVIANIRILLITQYSYQTWDLFNKRIYNSK
jgi:hypothetical protein